MQESGRGEVNDGSGTRWEESGGAINSCFLFFFFLFLHLPLCRVSGKRAATGVRDAEPS